ncbi:hypothetical protein C8R48DRAFT_163760 [Suillus tomentosus]|nr:hypothetical protein C8R48DRAFT_163760 [Suillus tomentosus]
MVLFSVSNVLTEDIVRFMPNNPRTYADPLQFNVQRSTLKAFPMANNGKKPETEPRTICFDFARRILAVQVCTTHRSTEYLMEIASLATEYRASN